MVSAATHRRRQATDATLDGDAANVALPVVERPTTTAPCGYYTEDGDLN